MQALLGVTVMYMYIGSIHHHNLFSTKETDRRRLVDSPVRLFQWEVSVGGALCWNEAVSVGPVTDPTETIGIRKMRH